MHNDNNTLSAVALSLSLFAFPADPHALAFCWRLAFLYLVLPMIHSVNITLGFNALARLAKLMCNRHKIKNDNRFEELCIWFCANWLIELWMLLLKEKDGAHLHAYTRATQSLKNIRVVYEWNTTAVIPCSIPFDSIRCEICGLHFNVITSIYFQKPKVVDIFSRHTLAANLNTSAYRWRKQQQICKRFLIIIVAVVVVFVFFCFKIVSFLFRVFFI